MKKFTMVIITFVLASASLAVVVAAAATDEQQRPSYHPNGTSSRSGRATRQSLTCYDFLDRRGARIEINAVPVSDLGYYPYYFDNRISSCTYNGIYILYDGYNYNSDLRGAVYAGAWGENLHVDLVDFSNKASSVRLTGAPDDYEASTLNFYEGEYFQGDEQYFYDNAVRVKRDDFGRSMIVTGYLPWTLYEYDYYEGRAACFHPGTNGAPRFYVNWASMEGMADRVSSVRLGCYSKLRVAAKYGESFAPTRPGLFVFNETSARGRV